ncbi:aldo/keto reductase [Colwellia sp. D2M02]|uniref:aldo/keto reductase n=1 Tax=Colwellia sp. D2M02 TaxID=2841562 RepID=UPI001C08094C|nr:aldo/keto reductase [Colwellia sp. D2M02]MBU2892937.1 aldo/keto reductase [Colwellia sp. D2M02]
MKIALGSVQFGCNYGISNQLGQVSHTEIGNILALAKQHNITVIDTAPAYGDSESRLGRQSIASDFNFVSKIAPDCEPQHIIASCQHSLAQLKTKQLSALMLHHGKQLLGVNGDNIYQELVIAKQQQLTAKIGCSVYSAQEAITLSKKFPLDIVQIPANIFDQGIFANNALQQLAEQKIEVHIRSLFLQGVIFLEPAALPPALKPLRIKLKHLNTLAQQQNNHDITTAKIAVALAPFIKESTINKLVIGCCSTGELQQIITAYELAKTITYDFSQFAEADENIINPSRW